MRPPESDQLDYEGEIAIVVGREGRRIPEERAREHVAGLTLLNEGSIRDWLRHSKFNVTQGKRISSAPAPAGPGSSPPTSSMPRFDRLRVSTRVNGELRQDDTTDHLLFPFTRLVAYVSTFMRLRPGDVISTGTPNGAGARFDPPRYLVPGDVVEVSSPSIGTLRNAGDRRAPRWLGAPRARRALPDFAHSLPMLLLKARESVMDRFRPVLRRFDLTEQQWRVIRALAEVDERDASELAAESYILAPSPDPHPPEPGIPRAHAPAHLARGRAPRADLAHRPRQAPVREGGPAQPGKAMRRSPRPSGPSACRASTRSSKRCPGASTLRDGQARRHRRLPPGRRRARLARAAPHAFVGGVSRWHAARPGRSWWASRTAPPSSPLRRSSASAASPPSSAWSRSGLLFGNVVVSVGVAISILGVRARRLAQEDACQTFPELGRGALPLPGSAPLPLGNDPGLHADLRRRRPDRRLARDGGLARRPLRRLDPPGAGLHRFLRERRRLPRGPLHGFLPGARHGLAAAGDAAARDRTAGGRGPGFRFPGRSGAAGPRRPGGGGPARLHPGSGAGLAALRPGDVEHRVRGGGGRGGAAPARRSLHGPSQRPRAPPLGRGRRRLPAPGARARLPLGCAGERGSSSRRTASSRSKRRGATSTGWCR